MGRFDGIDLSSEGSLKKMAKTITRQRVELLTELAQELFNRGERSAAKYLQDKAADEAREVGL